jgi:RimJ/RimL family protein N-acetyltransferase
MQYKKLQAEDFVSYNRIREMALETEPDAFISTNDEEKAIREERFNGIIQDKNNFIIGAFEDYELAGTVVFTRESRKKISHKGLITGMFVSSENRGKGIGLILLQTVFDFAFKIDGIRQIGLKVAATNIGAVKLYEKAGFVSYGLEKDAFCNNGIFIDDLYMVKFK